MNYGIFISAMMLIICGCFDARAQETKEFSDSEFLDGDWSSVKITDTTVGQTATYAAFCSTTGGNPDAYRHVTHNWCGDGSQSQGFSVGHLQNGAWYDPGQFGPILEIDVSLDAIFNPRVNPNAVACGPMIFQDGHYYRVQGTITAQSWTTLTFDDLTETDFVNLNGGPTTIPDFSGSGSPLQLGFFTANSTGGSRCLVTNSGFDNWLVTVSHQATPVKTTTWGRIKALY
jgi:hypothetical protein